MIMRTILPVMVLAGILPAAVQAQVAPPSASAPTPVSALDVPVVDTYKYGGEARRDPFLSLTAQVADSSAPAARVEGIAGLSVGDLAVRGVMRSRGTLIAMVEGPDNRAYVVHQGDKFADGTVRAVTADGLVIVQQVNDPLSLVKQREVRKTLRAVEDGKQ